MVDHNSSGMVNGSPFASEKLAIWVFNAANMKKNIRTPPGVSTWPAGPRT